MVTAPNKVPELVGIGFVSDSLGVSESAIREWERRGDVPAAYRVPPDGRRVYGPAHVELIRQRAARMRRRPATGDG
jgi:DNA-binding transcriptional MerR regulator